MEKSHEEEAKVGDVEPENGSTSFWKLSWTQVITDLDLNENFKNDEKAIDFLIQLMRLVFNSNNIRVPDLQLVLWQKNLRDILLKFKLSKEHIKDVIELKKVLENSNDKIIANASYQGLRQWAESFVKKFGE